MITCPLCSSKETSPNGLITNNINYQKCRACDFVFIPRPVPFDLKDVYNLDYAKLRGHDLINSAVHQSKLKTASWYFNKISKFIDVQEILDVGCSTGANLIKALELGWKATGVDVNEGALEFARLHIPGANFYSDLDNPNLKSESFSLVVLFDVIEHVEDLHVFIRKSIRLIKANGLILILTPDIDSLSAKIMRNQWPHLFSEHVSLFSRKNLISFLEGYNLKVVEYGFAMKFVSFQGLHRHLSCHFQAGILGRLTRRVVGCVKDIPLLFPFNLGETYVIARKI